MTRVQVLQDALERIVALGDITEASCCGWCLAADEHDDLCPAAIASEAISWAPIFRREEKAS